MAIGNLFGAGGESNSLYGTSLSTTPTSFIYFEWFIFKASSGQPATPTGGSWNFLTNTGTPPTGWVSSVNGVPLDNLWFSVAFVDSRNPTNIVWSTTGLISATTSVYASAYADKFTGNGSTTAWTLSADPVTVNNLDVSVNGVTQTPITDYTISGTTFTTTTAAPLGSILLVKYRQALPTSYYGMADNVGYLPAGTGAVLTNVQAKLGEHVSVKDFGAVGNGIVDDTAAIQACINAGTVGTYVGGYTVYFPSGTYKISGTLVSGVRRLLFLGDGTIGPSGTTLQQTNANADFFQSTYDSFSCYGMTFRGTDTTGMGVGTSNGLVIGQAPAGTSQRCFSGHISNCYFVFIPQASIKLVNAEDFHIHGNTIEITRYGIQLVQADQINIIDNTLYGCNGAGVYMQQGNDNKITANNFYLCGHAAGAGQLNRGGFVANYSATVESTTLNVVANNFNQCNIDVTLTGGVVSNPATHVGLNFVNVANNISRFADAQSIYINGPSNVKIAGHYFVDANYAAYSNTDGIAVYNSASSSCNGVKNVIVAGSPNAVRYGLYVDVGNTAFRYGNDNYFSGLTAPRLFVTTSVILFENLPTLATAELKPASSAANGEVVLEETALAQKNLIYYVGGSRFRVSGTSF